MRAVTCALLAVAIGCGSACDSEHRSIPIPVAPTVASAPPPIAPVAERSPAVLEITNVTIEELTPRPGQRDYVYFVKFSLTESTGKSGATIQRIWSSAGQGSEETGAECWREQIRVAPGRTLDVFDKGWDALAYCAPVAVSTIQASSVLISVAFTDDEGRYGFAGTDAPVAR